MIKNERQYRISKAQLDKFETAIANSKDKKKESTLSKLSLAH